MNIFKLFKDQLPKCEVCKVFSIKFHSTGACASVMCYVEFAATLFIVPSLLMLAVCVS